VVAKLAFTPQTKIWLFYALKDAGYMAWVSYAIFFFCLLYYCFYLLFSEDLTVVKLYELYDKDILLVILFREFLYKFMTWRLHLLYFSLRFLVIFTFCFSRLSSLLFRSLWFIILSFFVFSVSWSFDSILCAFS